MTDTRSNSGENSLDTEEDRTIIEVNPSRKSAKLSNSRIDEMKVNELKAELKKLGLAEKGKKTVLQDRLKAYIKGNEVRAGITDEEEEEEDEDTDEESEDEDEVEEQHGSSLFSIRDVEDSLTQFSGDDQGSVKKWVADFEDMAKFL